MMKRTASKPITVKSTVDLLIDRITDEIADGTYRPGDKLPSEPELAAIYGVGRTSIREAIRTLCAYGILEVRRPNGTFVCTEFKPEGINPFLYGLLLQSNDSYNELISLRKVLENGILLLLIERTITEKEEEEILNILHDFEEAANRSPASSTELIEYDIAFHNALAALTENRLIILENEMITKLTYASRLKTIDRIIENDQTAYLIKTHYDILETIKKKDHSHLMETVQNSYFYWKDIYS